MQNTIERRITVMAPKERVFKAITDPAEITSWFPDGIEGTLEVGATPVLDFGEYGQNRILITANSPHDYFAYRWVPCKVSDDPGPVSDVLLFPNTLVEFTLEEGADGTIVTVKETGFGSLPKELIEKSLLDNTSGWNYMMDRLAKLFSEGSTSL